MSSRVSKHHVINRRSLPAEPVAQMWPHSVFLLLSLFFIFQVRAVYFFFTCQLLLCQHSVGRTVQGFGEKQVRSNPSDTHDSQQHNAFCHNRCRTDNGPTRAHIAEPQRAACLAEQTEQSAAYCNTFSSRMNDSDSPSNAHLNCISAASASAHRLIFVSHAAMHARPRTMETS